MAKKFAFISYTRADQDSALLLHRELRDAFGAQKAWLDHENIKGGTTWMRSIDEAIETCSAFVVVIGKGWIHADKLASMRAGDDVVRLEVERALARHQDPKDGLVIMPILVDGAKMPSPNDLPPSMHPLLAIDAPDVRGHTLHNDLKPEVLPGLSRALGRILIVETKGQRRWRLTWLYTRLIALLAALMTGSIALFAWLAQNAHIADNAAAGLDFAPAYRDIFTDPNYMPDETYALAIAAGLGVFSAFLLMIWRLGGFGGYRQSSSDAGAT